MQENYNILSLFDRSGNLTLSAMERYLRNELSNADRSLIEKHLAGSAFDREALEGLQKHISTDPGQEVADLQQDILLAASKRLKTGDIRNAGKPYWYAAAGLAGLIALSVLLFFMFRNPVEKPQLAVMQPDTIVNEIAAITEQKAKSPIKETENIREEKAIIKSNPTIDPHPDKSPVPAEATRETTDSITSLKPDELKQQVTVVEDSIDVSDEMIIEENVVGGVAIAKVNKKAGKGSDNREKGSSTKYVTAAEREEFESINNLPVLDGDTNIFLVVERMPEFPGGEKALKRFMSDSLHYPGGVARGDIQRTVYLSFVVETDGSITNIRVLRGIGGGCDEEAVRLVKSMPEWIPGKQRGIPVRVQYNLPVKFSLE